MRSIYRGFSSRPSMQLGGWYLPTYRDYSLQKGLNSPLTLKWFFTSKSKTFMVRCRVRGGSWSVASFPSVDVAICRTLSMRLFEANKLQEADERLSPFPSLQRMIRIRGARGSQKIVFFSVPDRKPDLTPMWYHHPTRYTFH